MWNFALGAVIRGIDLRRREVPVVLMGLAILRLSDTDMAYFIKAEGDPLNTVLDNIEQHIHGQSRIAWIDHCNNYVPTSTQISTDIIIIIIILNNIQNYLFSIHYTLSSPCGWMLARSVYPPMFS